MLSDLLILNNNKRKLDWSECSIIIAKNKSKLECLGLIYLICVLGEWLSNWKLTFIVICSDLAWPAAH